MKSIGFRNFRKFPQFPSIELGDVTFLVGQNNSGKSTLVKALLLLFDYLNSKDLSQFPFSSKLLEDANINSFDRAIYRNAINKKITFYFEISSYQIMVVLHGEDNRNSGVVDVFKIVEKKSKTTLEINYLTKEANLKQLNKVSPSIMIKIEAYEKMIADLNKKLITENISKQTKEGIEIISRRNNLEEQIEILKNESKSVGDNIIYSFEEKNENFKTMSNAILHIVNDANRWINANENNNKEEKDSIFKNIIETSSFSNSQEEIENFSENNHNYFRFFINNEQYRKKCVTKYISATISKQSQLFLIKDSNNSLAQIIHEFQKLKISKEDNEYNLLIKWMKKFNIGDGFHIQRQTSEAYTVVIDTDNGKEHLADLGLGSLHLMNILLNTVVNIKKHNGNSKNSLIIIEEPELCLHPNLQAILADFFHEINKLFKVKFLVETHSEYLIRSSQLIVNKNQYSEDDINPFKVYYFKKEGIPYEMKYSSNGMFINKFDKGFIDVTDDIALELFKLNRK